LRVHRVLDPERTVLIKGGMRLGFLSGIVLSLGPRRPFEVLPLS
jgi:hypothetical protein